MMRPADRQPEKNTHCSALSALGLVPRSEIPPECRGVVVVWGISTLAARKNVAHVNGDESHYINQTDLLSCQDVP